MDIRHGSGKEGTHIWFSNGDPIKNDLWIETQPDNADNLEHCHEITYMGKLTGLNDRKCNEPKRYNRFICALVIIKMYNI